MSELTNAALKVFNKSNVDFGDIRLEERIYTTVRIANENLHSFSTVVRKGFSVRAFHQGAWGYSSRTLLKESAVKDAAEAAARIALINSTKEIPRSTLKDVKSVRKTVKAKLKKDPANVGIDEKVKLAMDVCKAQRIDERIASTVTSIDPSEMGNKIARESLQLLSARKSPSGMMTVITDPDVSGLLAHEVMGHASEADEITKRRSFLTDAIGKRVGSSLITMYDDGTYPNAHGSIQFDSEGSPSKKTKIIDHGIYKGFMHSLETAGTLRKSLTGNGRAQDHSRRVWVRMTNTYFSAGKDRFEEIVEETKSGLLTNKAISGMEDPVGGGFQAVALMGNIIEKGEIGPVVRGFTLTGKALAILKSADMISREFKLTGGFCGKGEEDYVPVSSGGPYMRSKIIVGGG